MRGQYRELKPIQQLRRASTCETFSREDCQSKPRFELRVQEAKFASCLNNGLESCHGLRGLPGKGLDASSFYKEVRLYVRIVNPGHHCLRLFDGLACFSGFTLFQERA